MSNKIVTKVWKRTTILSRNGKTEEKGVERLGCIVYEETQLYLEQGYVLKLLRIA